MAFKLSHTGTISIDNPIAMFNDLRNRKVKGLHSNQAEIINDYSQRAVTEKDVAIKVPTGGGKTLLALCLGEWRRRKFQERVVYLCPTKQLVNQVVAQAQSQYGIAVEPFLGSKNDFEPSAQSAYNGADVIGVTTYAALFNVNPFFSDPGTIILDDAHAAEGYISSHWTVRLEKWRKSETAPAFDAIVSLLKDSITEVDFLRLQAPADDLAHPHWCDKLPTPDLFKIHSAIVSSLDEHLKKTKQIYSWSTIRDQILACSLYYSEREILIRPQLAPTSTHRPFSAATQRIYLSATLGPDGDLERITGRRSIFRLKEGQGSERQGLGRRLFFFPGANLDNAEMEGVVTDFIQEARKAVILTTDSTTALRYKKFVAERLGSTIFNIEDIEKSKEPFVNSDNAVAILANRYDGIDFPDDECRLLFVSGRPTASSLHERFIVSRFGAIKALNDRILTRIVQAFGRCTRSSTDYAAVVILGGDLESYLEKRENRQPFHPELQAELDFGLEQARGSTRAEMLENLRLFLSRDSILSSVEGDILSKRDAAQVAVPSGAADLKTSANFEIGFSESMWAGNYLEALATARSVLGKLNDESLRGYRAMWHYLAGSAAWLAQVHDLGSDLSAASDQFKHAARMAPGIRWLNRLAVLSQEKMNVETIPDNKAMVVVENIELRIEDLQLVHDRKFDAAEAIIRKGLTANAATEFETSLKLLGAHLGYTAERPKGSAAPDGWWKADDELCFVFEVNSDGDEKIPLSATKARQANLHVAWVKEHVPLKPNATVIGVLITPKGEVSDDAKVFLKGVAYWDITDFRAWKETALLGVREARVGFSAGDLVWRACAADCLVKSKTAPLELKALLDNLIVK